MMMEFEVNKAVTQPGAEGMQNEVGGQDIELNEVDLQRIMEAFDHLHLWADSLFAGLREGFDMLAEALKPIMDEWDRALEGLQDNQSEGD